MFPLQPGDELVFGNPTISKPDKIPADQILDNACVATDYDNIINFSAARYETSGQLQRRKANGYSRQRETKNEEGIIRRVLHREIERKRRQQMSQLYVSLRDLLPLERVKGKRSVSDHMQEAVSYIQHMQKKIQRLRVERDRLKKLANLSSESRQCGADNFQNYLVVNSVNYGVEILISCSSENGHQIGLSKVLAEMAQREFHVFSCLSSRTNGWLLTKIFAEAPEMASLDLSMLQERLTFIIN